MLKATDFGIILLSATLSDTNAANEQKIEHIETKVNQIDTVEKSLKQVHAKLDGITQQVVSNSEELASV